MYEEEEHALRVMVKEEVEERMLAGEEWREGGRREGEREGGVANNSVCSNNGK